MGFIEDIAKYVQKYAPQYGIQVCSPIIAQAILESGSGTSDKVYKDGEWRHNYFGLKWRNNRCAISNNYFEEWTSEQNKNGSYQNIVSKFCKFKSMEDGVIGYFQWINTPNYSNLKWVKDPRTYLENIKADKYATSINYVQNLMNVINKYNLTQYDSQSTSTIINNYKSSLVDCTILSPNHSGKRTHSVDRITPHCVVGQLSAESIGNCFPKERKASCNYGIGKDGRVCLVVDEQNRSWCSSSESNDQRAITIECASDTTTPYAMTDAVYNKLILLCVDICKRYGKTKLLWFNDKNKTLNYQPAANEMVLTVHRWFKNKACPGDWLYSRLENLAQEVTVRLGGNDAEETQVKPSNPQVESPLYKVQTGAYRSKTNAQALCSELAKKGISPAIVIQANNLYKVQVGAYRSKENAQAMLTKVQKAGFSGFITGGEEQSSTSAYIVKVTTDSLRIRTGPGLSYSICGTITDRGKYTIIQEKNGFGKLKSGKGWISLSYTKKV